MRLRTLTASTAAVCLGLALAACGSGGGTDDGGASDTAGPSEQASAGQDRVQALASFYPLEFLLQAVGGDLVDVGSLAPAGAEPHDLELSPAQVAQLPGTDLVLYLSDFQPAVDHAVAETGAHALDIASAVDLESWADHTEADHDGEDHAEDGHDHGSLDPHFWLDPHRMSAAATAVADALSEIDPDNAATFERNAAALANDLLSIDEAYQDGLASCDSSVIVASHEAYGYLADAYGLQQAGVSGLDPESEPSPARLREISEIVRAEGVRTIFTESLVNPRVAQVLADDLGIGTAVLDPIEALTPTSDGADYLAIMRSNLESLRAGLGCA